MVIKEINERIAKITENACMNINNEEFKEADSDIQFINEIESKFEKNLKDLPKNELTSKKNSG